MLQNIKLAATNYQPPTVIQVPKSEILAPQPPEIKKEEVPLPKPNVVENRSPDNQDYDGEEGEEYYDEGEEGEEENGEGEGYEMD